MGCDKCNNKKKEFEKVPRVLDESQQSTNGCFSAARIFQRNSKSLKTKQNKSPNQTSCKKCSKCRGSEKDKIVPSSKYKSYQRPSSTSSEYVEMSSPEGKVSPSPFGSKSMSANKSSDHTVKTEQFSARKNLTSKDFSGTSSSMESLEEQAAPRYVKSLHCKRYRKLRRRKCKKSAQIPNADYAKRGEILNEKKQETFEPRNSSSRLSNAVHKIKKGFLGSKISNSQSEGLNLEINDKAEEKPNRIELSESRPNSRRKVNHDDRNIGEISLTRINNQISDEIVIKDQRQYQNFSKETSNRPQMWDNRSIDHFFCCLEDLKDHLELVRSGIQQLINHFTHPLPMELQAQEQVMIQFRNAIKLLQSSIKKFHSSVLHLPIEVVNKSYLIRPCGNTILEFDEYVLNLAKEFEHTQYFINESPMITMLKVVIVISVIHFITKRGRREFDTLVMAERSSIPGTEAVFEIEEEYKKFIQPTHDILVRRIRAMAQMQTFARVLYDTWNQTMEWDEFLPSLQLYLRMVKVVEPQLKVPDNWYLVRILPETRVMRSFDGFMSEFYRAIVSPDFVTNNPEAFGAIFIVMEYMLSNVISQHEVIVNDLKSVLNDPEAQVQNNKKVPATDFQKKIINPFTQHDIERGSKSSGEKDLSTPSDVASNDKIKLIEPLEGSETPFNSSALFNSTQNFIPTGVDDTIMTGMVPIQLAQPYFTSQNNESNGNRRLASEETKSDINFRNRSSEFFNMQNFDELTIHQNPRTNDFDEYRRPLLNSQARLPELQFCEVNQNVNKSSSIGDQNQCTHGKGDTFHKSPDRKTSSKRESKLTDNNTSMIDKENGFDSGILNSESALRNQDSCRTDELMGAISLSYNLEQSSLWSNRQNSNPFSSSSVFYSNFKSDCELSNSINPRAMDESPFSSIDSTLSEQASKCDTTVYKTNVQNLPSILKREIRSLQKFDQEMQMTISESLVHITPQPQEPVEESQDDAGNLNAATKSSFYANIDFRY